VQDDDRRGSCAAALDGGRAGFFGVADHHAPGCDEFSFDMLVALDGAACRPAVTYSIKFLSRTEPPTRS